MALFNYDKVRTIKSGKQGTSEVLEIKDAHSEEHYALKIIRGIDTSLYNVIFEREVGALTKLRTCNNIVRLEYYDTYNYEDYGKCGRVFLEYIDGETLQNTDLLQMSNPDKFNIIKQLIDAVQVAHENNIIHRDINPKNIMITMDKRIKLIDFGISKIKDMINTDTVYQFATNRYAAPEVNSHSENATEKSDIYSLGAVIFYIFTGEEPPLSNEFEHKLNKTSGIDVELKEIIKQMIKISPDERFNSIFEVRSALLKLFKRFTKTDREYVFSIDIGKIYHMRNLSLIPDSGSHAEIIENNIYNEFLESYIFVDNENKKGETYSLYGNHCLFECVYDDIKQVFNVVKVQKLQPFKREEIKKKAMYVNGNVKIILNGKRIPSNNNFELTNDAKSSKIRYLSSANVNNEYTTKFYAWHKLLEIMEAEYKNNIISVNYNEYKIEGDYCIFSISEEEFYILEENKDEINFIYERTKGNKTKIQEIGAYNETYIENKKFVLKVSIFNKNSLRNLPAKGTIKEDYRSNLSLVHREQKALNSFNNEDYASASNLKSIFSGIQMASFFESPNTITFYNDMLDSTQRSSVKKALNSQDISLIQGPPGTGKTNVIIEIIRQILTINNQGNIFKQKILIVSQAHAAVDKMLEDLDAEIVHDRVKIIRIGREEKLTDLVREKYSVDYAQLRWVKEIKDKSNKFALSLLSSLNIKKEEFDRYYEFNLKEKLGFEEKDKNKNFDNNFLMSFREKHYDKLDSKEFKLLLLQKDWVSRIDGRQDIQQHFIKNAEIVSGTCTGVVSNHVINDMIFDYVIIDEAAKATFPELLVSIIKGKKIILVGDHRQLPPILDNELIKNNERTFTESNLDVTTLYDSIFMKLYDYLPEENKQILNTQYRMHPTIGTMISKIFYNNQITNGVSIEERKHSINSYKNLAIVWIDTSKSQERFEEKISTTYTYRNHLEASIVKEQLKIIDDESKGYNYDVGVITPYSGQKNLISSELQQCVYNNINGSVVINSVDAFQGGQKDIIIYSTVRSSDKHNKIGFLKSEERLNVAFSRAKRLLVIVGDLKFLNNTSIPDNRFPHIIQYIKENKLNCKIVEYKKHKKN